jgi:hypothetical protein
MGIDGRLSVGHLYWSIMYDLLNERLAVLSIQAF